MVTLPYQSELVEHSDIFSEVSCIQRYRYLVLSHSLSLTLTLSLSLSLSLSPLSSLLSLGEVAFPDFLVIWGGGGLLRGMVNVRYIFPLRSLKYTRFSLSK